jgi:flagellar M-ring protein FliF
MPQSFKQAVEQVKTLLRELSTPQKVTVVLFTTVTIISFIFLFIWAKRPTMKLLYGNLGYQDAISIKTKLDELKVAYTVSDDGSAVYVPSNQVGEMRMLMAGEGIVRGGLGKGFELFDTTQIGITDFAQKLNYQRALQSELARTIMELDSVESARVHLVLKRESVFSETEEPAKASVIVKLKRGASFTKGQAVATANLVAGSIEGLDPHNVTVVDVAGNVLSQATDKDDFYTVSASQLELQRNIEKELESKILNVIEPIVGNNNARTKVTVELASDSIEQTEEIYNPDASVVKNEETVDEQSKSGQSGGGVPGTVSNLDTTNAGSSPPNDSSSKSKTVSKTNYELSKTMKHTVKTPGAIKKLSVALVVNDALKVVKSSTETKFESQPRTDDELEKYKKIIMSAVGYDQTRGDDITVSNISFDTSSEEKNKLEMESMQKEQFWISIAKYPAMVLLFIILFFFLLRPLLRFLLRTELPMGIPGMSRVERIPGSPRMREIPGEVPKTIEEIENELSRELSENSLTVEAQKRGILQKRIYELAEKQPEKVADVVRLWLTES